ncbi:MAG: hypothetical protein ACOYX1_13015 [Acidobacteriota bacterium]
MAPLFAMAVALGAQQLPAPPPGREEPKRLPDGRLWSEAVIKANHEANLKDLERMRKILDSVQEEIEKSKGHVLPLRSLKELEELERISKRVRDRMRRH